MRAVRGRPPDRQKATRALRKAQRELAEAGDDDEARAAAEEHVVAAQADLYYTRNYPAGVKYLALFPSAPDGDPAAPVLRQRVREHLQQRIRDGDIADPDVTLPEGDRGIRELVTEIKPKAVVKPKAADAPSATRAAPAAAAKPAEPRKAATPGKATTPAAAAGAASKKASTPAPAPKQEKAAAASARATQGAKRARDEDDEDTGDSADDSDSEEDEQAGSADERGKKAAPLEDLSSDDFFSAAPVAKTRRLKEYKVDTGEHRPELSSRRAWLKQRKYVCAGTRPTAARPGRWLTRRGALSYFLRRGGTREEREVLSKKGGVIKRQKKEFLHGGDLPESLESLKHGRPAQPGGRTHQRFDDDDDDDD